MSDYTTQLRFICEAYANRTDKPRPQSDVDNTIALARPMLFDFDYPIFDPDYKETLETKIISHFYTREIGLETVGLFKLHLKNKMREIMPYYNQLYESEKIKFDPLVNIDYTNESNEKTEGQSVGTAITSEATHNENDVDSERNIARDDTTTFSDATHSQTDNTAQNDSTVTNSGMTTENYKDYKETDKRAEVKTTNPNTTTLVKHSDTPLGSVDNVTGDNSNYLSDVTETDVTGGTTTVTQQGETGDTHEKTGKIEHIQGDGSDATKNPKTVSSEEQASSSETSATDNSTTVLDSDVKDSYNEHSEGNGTRNVTGNTQDDTTGSRDYFAKFKGKNSSETFSEMLNKFRQTFLNIDLDVIHELDNLFMLVW